MDEELKKKLEKKAKEIEAQLERDSGKLSGKSGKSAEVSEEGVKIKKLEEVEKELEEKASEEEVKELAGKEPVKKRETGRIKPKPIERVERELEKRIKEPAKTYAFADGVKEAARNSKKRKFPQTWDLIFSLKGIDLKRPENRLNLEYTLPEGRGKDIKVGVFADSLAADAKGNGADVVIRRAEIADLAKDKKKLKNIADSADWFYGEVTLMAEIGKSLGAVLGPRGKVPKPIPPKVDVGLFIKKAKRSVRVQLKDSPVIQVPIGVEGMDEAAVLKNLEGVYGFVREKLPKGANSIRSLHLKLTMGKPVRLEVR